MLSFRALQGSSRRDFAPDRSAASVPAPPLRSLPLQRLPAMGQRHEWAGCSTTRSACVFGFSQPLDAFIRPTACRSCFIPDPLLGLRPSEHFPFAQPCAVIRRRCPPVVALPFLTRPSRRPPRASTLRSPFFASPSEQPSPTGLCSTRKSAAPPRLFRPTCCTWLSWAFSPSRAFSLVGIAMAFARLSPHGLLLGRRERLLRVPHRVYASNEMGWSLSRLPALLGFSAFWSSTNYSVCCGSGVASSSLGVRHRPLPDPL